MIDIAKKHYTENRFLNEHPDAIEAPYSYKNVGWSLGNACHLKCKQCYSKSARERGMDLNKDIIDLIIKQILSLGTVKTVNLGGNEPIYTNGLDIKNSLLPYVIEQLVVNDIKVGITTAGPTLIYLEKYYKTILSQICDVDISLDSPIADEHDDNRGQKGIFDLAVRCLEIAKAYNIPRSIIMCGMNWNFTPDRLGQMIKLAKENEANFRVNPIKPIEPKHLQLVLTPGQFFVGLELILSKCDPIDLSDPAWAALAGISSKVVSGCPCGVNSFRIHSITPKGEIPVAPCVYLHDYKFGDLAKQDLKEIINSTPFQAFRRRKANPNKISGCENCPKIDVCGGGCAARAYLHHMHSADNVERSLFVKDPYCPVSHMEQNPKHVLTTELTKSKHALVHEGYLCTGIFVPK